MLDESVDPVVGLHGPADFVRNGTNPTNRTIVGTVYDTEPYELTDVRITTSEDRTYTASLNTTTAPATNATFAERVRLSERVVSVTATVEDPAVVRSRTCSPFCSGSTQCTSNTEPGHSASNRTGYAPGAWLCSFDACTSDRWRTVVGRATRVIHGATH